MEREALERPGGMAVEALRLHWADVREHGVVPGVAFGVSNVLFVAVDELNLEWIREAAGGAEPGGGAGALLAEWGAFRESHAEVELALAADLAFMLARYGENPLLHGKGVMDPLSALVDVFSLRTYIQVLLDRGLSSPGCREVLERSDPLLRGLREHHRDYELLPRVPYAPRRYWWIRGEADG